MKIDAKLKVFLIAFMVEYVVSTNNCPESHETLMYVVDCPKTSNEWKERGQVKNCQTVKQNCTESNEFQYHCLVNEYVNSTVEVCAPVREILGSNCAEYNVIGRRIQESAELKCLHCSFRYKSNISYEYQECYDSLQSSSKYSAGIKGKHNKSSGCVYMASKDVVSEKSYLIWLILFILAFAFDIGFAVALIRKHILKPSDHIPPSQLNLDKTETTRKERVPMLSEQDAYMENVDLPENSRADHVSPICPEYDIQVGKDKKKCVVAIQLGERICGIAYSKGDDPANVILNTCGKFPKPYTTTRLFIDKGDEDLFGFDALTEYIERCKKNQTKDLMYFDNMEMDGTEGSLYVKDVTGKKEKADKIYKKYLNCVITYAIQELNKILEPHTPSPSSDIKFVVTLPNSWDQQRRELIENVVNQILGKDACHEVDTLTACLAVSSFLHEVKEEVLCHNFNVDNLSFPHGTTYAVLNVGTYACEVIILRSTNKEIDEICHKVKALYGRDSPEKRFLYMLGDAFKCDKVVTENIFGTLKEKFPGDYFSIMQSFENWQLDCETNMKEVKIELSSDFFKLVKKLKNSIAKSVFERSGYGNDEKMKLEGNDLFIMTDLMKTCYVEMAELAAKLAEKEVTEEFMNVRCICITGVYARLDNVKNILKKKFKYRTVLFPSIPDLVVAKGAAFYGYKRIISS